MRKICLIRIYKFYTTFYLLFNVNLFYFLFIHAANYNFRKKRTIFSIAPQHITNHQILNCFESAKRIAKNMVLNLGVRIYDDSFTCDITLREDELLQDIDDQLGKEPEFVELNVNDNIEDANDDIDDPLSVPIDPFQDLNNSIASSHSYTESNHTESEGEMKEDITDLDLVKHLFPWSGLEKVNKVPGNFHSFVKIS